MSKDLNLCQFIGRLGQDPEIRYMPNGDAVANLSIACGDDYKDKNGNKVEQVEWVKIVAFRRLAEIMGEYLKKGSQVYISGKMKTKKWQDNNGQDRYTTEIIADQMQMLDSRAGISTGGTPSGSQGDQPSPQAAPDDGFDDDLPF